MFSNDKKEMLFNYSKGKNGSWYATAENDQFNVSIRTRSWDDKASKTRLYISGEDDVDFTEADEADRVDGGPKPRGERLEVDKLFDKLNRQVVRNQKAVALEAIANDATLADLLDGRKMVFNRKAGCSCGCSPAFILDGALYAETEQGRKVVSSIWITRRNAD